MSEYIEEVGLSALNYNGHAITIITKKDNSEITFKVGPDINNYLTNILKISDGRTVGQANRDGLHARLDALLDANLE